MTNTRSVRLLSVPYDANSSFTRGTAGAPTTIRERLFSPAGNLYTENLVDLAAEDRLIDEGDIEVRAFPEDIISTARHLLKTDCRLLALGGDHSITYPLIKACSEKYPNLSVIQFDAHPDLYHDFEGNRWSHASPFARVMEDGLTETLVQCGIRASSKHLHEQQERFNVVSLPVGRPIEFEPLQLTGPFYVSIDMDSLDPAFAPGVSHPEPGGLTMRELIDAIKELPAHVVAGDIVELNPLKDSTGITAAAAAKLVKELAGKMLEV